MANYEPAQALRDVGISLSDLMKGFGAVKLASAKADLDLKRSNLDLERMQNLQELDLAKAEYAHRKDLAGIAQEGRRADIYEQQVTQTGDYQGRMAGVAEDRLAFDQAKQQSKLQRKPLGDLLRQIGTTSEQLKAFEKSDPAMLNQTMTLEEFQEGLGARLKVDPMYLHKNLIGSLEDQWKAFKEKVRAIPEGPEGEAEAIRMFHEEGASLVQAISNLDALLDPAKTAERWKLAQDIAKASKDSDMPRSPDEVFQELEMQSRQSQEYIRAGKGVKTDEDLVSHWKLQLPSYYAKTQAEILMGMDEKDRAALIQIISADPTISMEKKNLLQAELDRMQEEAKEAKGTRRTKEQTTAPPTPAGVGIFDRYSEQREAAKQREVESQERKAAKGEFRKEVESEIAEAQSKGMTLDQYRRWRGTRSLP